MPVDRLEEAVCNGDHSNLDVLLRKKKNGGFLRSKVQKALHSKRVTALHFAALFGEIEMAHRLLNAGFEINEVPQLSTSSLTPLKFAVGARQVDMVALLIANGAKPVEPDTWSTLIGQLMDRSWITSTMSVAEREDLHEAPNNMIAIMQIWLKHGWNVNRSCEASSGRTMLHQAVAFESGYYEWDSNLRTTMIRFLCDHGANPLKPDTNGNTPYEMTLVVDDQDLLPVLEQRLERKRQDEEISGLVELSARPPSPVELFDRSTTVPSKPPNDDCRSNIRLLQELDGGRVAQAAIATPQ
jgi:ankyrin repeat protein